MIEERRKEASKGFLTDKGFDPREAGALDVWFTYLYMKYASDLADGLSDLAQDRPRMEDQAGEIRFRSRTSKRRSTQNRIAESLARTDAASAPNTPRSRRR